MEDIEIENQAIGFLMNRREFRGNNLKARNCEIGFLLNDLSDSNLTRLSSRTTTYDYYSVTYIRESTIEIEKGSKFYFINFEVFD